MKRIIVLILAVFLLIPQYAGAVNDEYEVVSRLEKENITLYAKKTGSLYTDFKIDFKGETYSQPFWTNVTNPSYAPQLFYEDINNDGRKDLTVILNKGYGTGVLDEEVYVSRYNNRLVLEIVDDPLAIVDRNVLTRLAADKAEIILPNGKYVLDITPLGIEPENLFVNISFGNIMDFEVIDNQLTVRVGGQISPAAFVGSIVIVYAYRDNMYLAKSVEFQPGM
jgi:hypothetical protein